MSTFNGPVLHAYLDPEPTRRQLREEQPDAEKFAREAWPSLPWRSGEVYVEAGDRRIVVPRAVFETETTTALWFDVEVRDGRIWLRAHFADVPDLVCHDPAPRFEGIYFASDAKGRQG